MSEEHPLARRTGFRPYSELSDLEKSEIASYLEAFEKKFGKVPDFDPKVYWWQKGRVEWIPFNTESVIL